MRELDDLELLLVGLDYHLVLQSIRITQGWESANQLLNWVERESFLSRRLP